MLKFRLTLVACFLSFSAQHLLAQCPITVDAGEDIYLCAPPTPTQLNGDISGPYLGFTWSPMTGMSGGTSLTPTVTVSQTTTYVLSATAPDFGNNLVDNGDFEGGNAGFSSDYGYSPGNLVPEGLYDVLDNPQNDHPGFAPCHDHTSGSGNMMVVNGAGTPNQNVWCQTVPVTANTQYVLSAYVTSVVASSPAKLQFSINGVPLGGIFNAPGGTCNWQNFFQVWNSTGNTSATICIVNQNTVLGGNDFALDDIVFAPVCTATDTVKVFVVNVSAVASPPVVTIPCEGASIQISGNGSSTGPNITYDWSTPNGNILSGSNTLTPTVNAPGEYTLTVSYEVNGSAVCTKTATVTVILNPSPLSVWVTPPQPLGCGSPTTFLIGNSSQPAFSSYQWSTVNGIIVGNSDQKNCTVSQVGTYTLLVTNTATGCTATTDVLVTITNNIPVANANSNGMITCVQDSVPLLGTGSSTGPNIIYTWTTLSGQISGPTNSLNSTASAGGVYILNVTNSSNNCTTRDTVIVPANVTPPSVLGTLPSQISCDPNQDTITLHIIPGPPPIVQINWATSNGHIVSGQFTPNPQVDLPGTYIVSVLDTINGCFSYDTSLVIANFSVPTAGILPADTLTCQSPSIQLLGSGTTNGANFSIQWSASNGGNIVSGDNTLSPTVNAAGDYLLILRDSVSLCVDTAMVRVQADTNVVSAVANTNGIITCANPSAVIVSSGSSSGSNISYQWTTTDGNFFGSPDSMNTTVIAAGTYQLLVVNTANGCSATDITLVVQDTVSPLISVSPPGTITCQNPTQTIQAQIIPASGSFLYQWISQLPSDIVSGQGTNSITVNQPGTYSLGVINLANGCSAVSSATVLEDKTPPNVITAFPGPLTCVTFTQVLSSSGSSSGPDFSYQWTSTNGNISIGADTPSPTVTEPGTYQLEILNIVNGCSATSTIVVPIDTLAPTALIQTPTGLLNCQTTQLELLGNGTGAGTWTTNNGNILFTAGFTAQIDAPGAYVFTTTDPSNGCTATSSVEIFEDVQIPNPSITPPNTLNCLINSVMLNATSSGQSLQFDWQTTSGNLVSGQNTASPLVNAPGDYTLTVTDGINGCTNTTTVNVPQDTAHPNILIAPPPTITCDFPTITAQAQNLSLPGMFSYTWTASGGANIVSGANSLEAIMDAGGLVTFSCSNAVNGCETFLSVNIPQDTNAPVADAGPDNSLSCLTNTLTINGSGTGASNLEYTWQSTGGGNIQSGGNGPTPVVDQPGIYTLTVRNPANGCTATDMVQILNDANAPAASAGTAATLTCTVLQTNLNGSGSAGNNITYNWTAASGGNILLGQNTLTPTVTEPGIYTLAVTNASNGCVATSSVTVPEDVMPPGVDAGAIATLTCSIKSLSLMGSSTGGAATYAWNANGGGNIISGANTLTPTVNKTGNYILTATLLSNGCSAMDAVTVGIDTLAPGFQIQPPVLLTCSQLTSPLQGNVQQPGAGNFSATWSTQNGHFVSPQNNLNTLVDAPGVYILSIQNTLNGCDAQQQVNVNQDTIAPTALAAPGGQITCSVQSLHLDGNGSSTGNNYTYTWTADGGGSILSGSNTLTPTVGSAGTYTLLVKNTSTGCSSTTTTNVGSNNTPPTAAIAQPGILTCLQNTVTLDGSGSSQGTNFSANWATSGGNIVSGQGTFTAVVNQIGNYLLTIVNNQNGCTQTAQVLVQEDKATPGALILPAPTLNCKLPEIILVGSSPTLGSISYSWMATAGGNIISGTNTPTPLINEAGTYTLQVSSQANGCSSSTSLSVTATPDPGFTPSLIQPNCFDPLGVVDFGAVTDGKPPFQYSTDGGQNFESQALFDGVSPGTYSLVVSDENGCTAEEMATINQPFLPSLSLEAILKIEQGDSILLTPLTNIAPSQIASWQWTPASGLSCTDCAEPWAKPAHSQYYTVNVADLNGCRASDRILIQVSRQRHIYTPTAFTPNDDGENDRFTLYAKGVKEIRSLSIFDRWGDEVFLRKNFQPNDESLGWDGTFRGSPLTPAVFVWTAEVEFLDGEVEVIYGDVTVIR